MTIKAFRPKLRCGECAVEMTHVLWHGYVCPKCDKHVQIVGADSVEICRCDEEHD